MNDQSVFGRFGLRCLYIYMYGIYRVTQSREGRNNCESLPDNWKLFNVQSYAHLYVRVCRTRFNKYRLETFEVVACCSSIAGDRRVKTSVTVSTVRFYTWILYSILVLVYSNYSCATAPSCTHDLRVSHNIIIAHTYWR